MANQKRDGGRHWRNKTLMAGFREATPRMDSMTIGQLRKAYKKFQKENKQKENKDN